MTHCQKISHVYDACITQSLKKQMTKLAVHSVGSRVVELLFATFPNKSTAPLKLELYGPQYALFASAMPPSKDDKKNNTPTLPTLEAFIENNPDKIIDVTLPVKYILISSIENRRQNKLPTVYFLKNAGDNLSTLSQIAVSTKCVTRASNLNDKILRIKLNRAKPIVAEINPSDI